MRFLLSFCRVFDGENLVIYRENLRPKKGIKIVPKAFSIELKRGKIAVLASLNRY
jgi:hypothetical protein